MAREEKNENRNIQDVICLDDVIWRWGTEVDITIVTCVHACRLSVCLMIVLLYVTAVFIKQCTIACALVVTIYNEWTFSSALQRLTSIERTFEGPLRRCCARLFRRH